MKHVSIRWEPAPPFGWMNNTKPFKVKLATYLQRMVDEQHRKSGEPPWKPSQRFIAAAWKYHRAGKDEGAKVGRTGHKTGRLWRGWKYRATEFGAEGVNRTPYAEDFYYGHPRRRVFVPASYRRIRRTAKLHGQKRARKQTVAISMVKGHYTTEPAQVARPITFTPRYVRFFEGLMAKYAATGKV